MPTLVNTFETALASGTVLTAANSGAGAAGAAADNVEAGAGNSIAYSNARAAHGTLSALISIGVSTGQPAYLEWSTSLVAGAYPGAVYSRVAVNMPALPSNSEVALLRGLFGGNQRWAVRLRADGRLAVWGDGVTNLGTSTTALTPNTWWRIEAVAVATATAANNSIEVRVFAGDSQVPTETLSYTPAQMGGPIDRVRFGVGNGVGLSSAWSLHVDDIGASTTTWLGPAIAVPTVSHAWVGAVTHTSAVVSYGLANASSARLAVSTSAELSSPTFSSPGSPDADGFVKLSVSSLTPDTTYHFGVEVGGEILPAGRGTFRTDPTPGTPTSFSIAFGSCQQTNSNSQTFAVIAAKEGRYGRARRFVHEGDLHYRDFGAGTTAADIAGQYKASLATPNMRTLLATIPTTYSWDNHDWGGPDSNASAPAGPLLAAAYRKVVPHYPLATAGSTAIHQSFVIGRVRFIILDTRSQRSPRTMTESSSKTLLGAEQKAWFKQQLLAPEPLKIVVSGIYWRRDSVNGDRWGSYQVEWAEIRDWVAAQNGAIGGVLVISGDRHALYADDGTGDAATGGTYWPNVGGAAFDQGSSDAFETWTHGYYAGVPLTNLRAFGWLDIRDDGPSITVDYSGITSLDGQTRVSMSLTVPAGADLTAARWGIHV